MYNVPLICLHHRKYASAKEARLKSPKPVYMNQDPSNQEGFSGNPNPVNGGIRPSLTAIGFMPPSKGHEVPPQTSGNDGTYSTIGRGRPGPATVIYNHPPEDTEDRRPVSLTSNNGEVLLQRDPAYSSTQSHTASLLGLDPPVMDYPSSEPRAPESVITLGSQPSAVPYNPVSFAGMNPEPYDDHQPGYASLHRNPNPPTALNQISNPIHHEFNEELQSNEPTLPVNHDLKRYSAASRVDHIRVSKIRSDGTQVDDLYALPSKRSSYLRNSQFN